MNRPSSVSGGKMVLWLARKDQAQEGNVGSSWPQRRFAPSRAGGVHRGGQLAHAASRSPTPRTRPKSFCPTAPGGRWPLVRQDEQMAGSFHDTQLPGDYAIEVTATQKDQPLGTARARFLVFRQDLELDNASADAPTLESLAAMTGGQSLAPEQLPGSDSNVCRGHATPRRAARDEKDLLGHLAVLLDHRRAAGGGVVSAEAVGAGVVAIARLWRLLYIPLLPVFGSSGWGGMTERLVPERTPQHAGHPCRACRAGRRSDHR